MPASASEVSAFGLSVGLPNTWDARVFQLIGTGPTLHAGNFPIPRSSSNWGGPTVDTMRPGNMFIVVLEYVTQLPQASGAFSRQGVPAGPWTQQSFSPQLQQGNIRPGFAGRQDTFCVGQRCFMLYMVMYRNPATDLQTIREAQQVLAHLTVDKAYMPTVEGTL